MVCSNGDRLSSIFQIIINKEMKNNNLNSSSPLILLGRNHTEKIIIRVLGQLHVAGLPVFTQKDVITSLLLILLMLPSSWSALQFVSRAALGHKPVLP